jgi:hypothetical protein
MRVKTVSALVSVHPDVHHLVVVVRSALQLVKVHFPVPITQIVSIFQFQQLPFVYHIVLAIQIQCVPPPIIPFVQLPRVNVFPVPLPPSVLVMGHLAHPVPPANVYVIMMIIIGVVKIVKSVVVHVLGMLPY